MTITETDQGRETGGRRRRGGGAEGRRALRQSEKVDHLPYIRRTMPDYEVLGEEGLALIEANADLILEEIGIEFREDEEALALWRGAGADVRDTRVHFRAGCAARCSPPHPTPSPSTRATRSAASRSAARRLCSPPCTGRLSCATSTKAGATGRSRISATS
jgi:hypothetical protein